MQSATYACGLVCLYGEKEAASTIQSRLRDILCPPHESDVQNGPAYSFALVFYSKSSFSTSQIIEIMAGGACDLKYAACTTSGEITPSGMTEQQLVILLFPSDIFNVHATVIEANANNGLEKITANVAKCKREFVAHQHLSSDKDRAKHQCFAISLMDGMSFLEETITAAMHWGLEDIPLLGGSAGDDLDFDQTSLILNGKLSPQSALLLIFSSKVPTHIFKTENFRPTDIKLVVTKSDPELRIVYELNAAPAVEEYAGVIGVPVEDLGPQAFASHPLVVRVGGEYYCRSIQKVNDDGSLSFFCAIDDGVVLTVAEPKGMASTTQDAFASVRAKIGEIDFVLGFDCVLRLMDARNRQVTHKISKIYKNNNVIGFNTYGEQYRSMHLNQTFTGIAFGKL